MLDGAEPVVRCDCCAQDSTRSLSGRRGWVVLHHRRGGETRCVCPECAELPESQAELRADA